MGLGRRSKKTQHGRKDATGDNIWTDWEERGRKASGCLSCGMRFWENVVSPLSHSPPHFTVWYLYLGRWWVGGWLQESMGVCHSPYGRVRQGGICGSAFLRKGRTVCNSDYYCWTATTTTTTTRLTYTHLIQAV